MFKRSYCIAALCASLAATAAVASDRPARVVETEDSYATVVRFDDLDLDRQAGAETLYERLKAAARRVCNSQTGSGGFRGSAEWSGCYTDAIRRAVEGIGNRLLTELHFSRSDSG